MFHFYQPPGCFKTDFADAHVGMIPAGITDVRSLLDAVGGALAFPPYFGRNFDALWDCLTGMESIRETRVALVHADPPELAGGWTKTYLETLRDAVLFWQKRPEHDFTVWFPTSRQKAAARYANTQ